MDKKNIKIDGYEFDSVLFSKYKRLARLQYKKYIDFWKDKKNIKSSKPIQLAGIYESDFSIHYKTNGLIKFKNYLIVIKKNKKHIYF